MNINEMPQTNLLKYIQQLDQKQIINLFTQDLNNDVLNMLFLNCSNETKIEIIKTPNLCSKLIKLLNTNMRKIVYYITDDILIELLKQVDISVQKTILLSLKEERFKIITEQLPALNWDLVKDDAIINYEEYNQLSNSYYIYKIKNKIEYDILNKYHIYLSTKIDNNNIIFNNDEYLPYSIMFKLYDKRINTLLDIAFTHNPNTPIDIVFTTVIKMYAIFGYDNSYKILSDKFTYRTINSIERAGIAKFIDERRQFRLDHQYLFYSYDLITYIMQELDNGNDMVLKPYCHSTSEIDLYNLINKLRVVMQEYNNQNESLVKRNLIANIIKKEIIEREQLLWQNKINEYKQLILTLPKREPLQIEEMANLLLEVDISNIKLDNRGRVLINNKLNKFLLGNTKTDNDALLRLVLNNDALGINKALSMIINDFKKIDRIIAKNENLSLNSILDVIDVCKACSYNLTPNEEDMSLETVVLLLNSAKFCTESKEAIFARIRKLHVDRKKKICSSIPLVNGIYNDVKYQVIPFDDPDVLRLGIDAGDCLKVGGKGEEYLNYLLLSPHGVIVSLVLPSGDKYICPFIRNGNALFGNGIDPEPKSEREANLLLSALQACARNMIHQSYHTEPIQMVTVTDLHQIPFFSKKGFNKITINESLAIDSTFYADYYKDELTNYIISASSNFSTYQPYIPKQMYYERRRPEFVMDVDSEDKERIEIVINDINYTSIDYLNVSDKEKSSLKRKYKKLNVNDYNYIIGNKDWFIAISPLEVVSKILPFDERAKQEYFKALESIREKYSNGLEGKIWNK